MRVHRVAAVAGFVCAVLLVVNSARRAGFLPENALTHAIAPFGALTGLLAITGIYLVIRGTAGTLGLVGYVLNSAGLAGAFAIEYILHFVFPYLGGGTVSGLLAGSTGRAFLVTSVVLVAGALTFSAAAIRSGVMPVVGVLLYAVGMLPGSLRNLVPVPVYLAGLLVAAAGVAWMSARLWATEEKALAYEEVREPAVRSARRGVRPTG
ncbi:hypothetical protein SAMN05444920_13927 [Nonomuraea solani]|uniref:Uncharacterized protein n=1 Tax=Nonomuraea solani TaxID=1144553 RepID=A0A1H6F086_9ACTN|nr:hypothetical protein [Nonomuraea solani]SEH03568.1 hypothetical protein SAMN05444920_13927 [Nonomuraea solani]